ncbi:hypothetical protein BDZ45DRAFT_749782 [Acephala macrosclerotiorum]|nr:hypothetical protein BDZ45DRAFT_749782 [Acephala macrosclerotiorum]
MGDQNRRSGKLRTQSKVAAKVSVSANDKRNSNKPSAKQAGATDARQPSQAVSSMKPSSSTKLPAKSLSNFSATGLSHTTPKRAMPTKVETSYIRLPGANADVSITASSATLNQYKVIKSAYAEGPPTNEKSYPFQAKGYDFTAHFTHRMTTAQRKDFLAGRWVEIVVRVPAGAENPTSIIDQLAKFGPDLAQHVENLVIKLEIPTLTEIFNTNLADLPASPGYLLVEKVVEEVGKFPHIARMNVVLSMPHNFSNSMHNNQLSYILPFYKLAFTRWVFRYQVPAIFLPHLAPKDTLNRLNNLYDIALKRKQDGDIRVLDSTYKRESIFEPEKCSHKERCLCVNRRS